MEENKLRQHIGKNEPFKVPEGYFDNFAARMQSRIAELPQAQKPTKRVHLVPKAWFAAAASVVIVASVGLSIMLPKMKSNKAEAGNSEKVELASATQVNAQTLEESYYYDELDYAMIDNNEIAYYLTEY